MIDAPVLGASFHHIPNYVGGHTWILQTTILQNAPEHFAFFSSRIVEPMIRQILAQCRHEHGLQASASPLQTDNNPAALPQLQLIHAELAASARHIVKIGGWSLGVV